jgi:hypothetical protein
MQYTTCAPFYLVQPSVESIEKLFGQKGDDGLTPTEGVLGVADYTGRTRERGFTIVELRGCDGHIHPLGFGGWRLQQSREWC